MIKDIIDNASINTKMHAKMRGRLGKKEYRELSNMHTIPEIAEYLRANTRYKEVLEGIDIESIHRGQLEMRLHRLITGDLHSFLAFSGTSAKFFLSIYAIKDEIAYIKFLLRLIDEDEETRRVVLYKFEGDYYNDIDFAALAAAKTVDAFLGSLRGTIYEKPLRRFIQNPGMENLFEIETALDMFYRNTVWTFMAKFLSKEEQQIVERAFGVQIDLENIMFIVRAKKYYNMPTETVYPYVGERSFRLKDTELRAIMEAESDEAALAAVKSCCYGKLFEDGFLGIENKIQAYILKLHRSSFRKKPYSIEAILCYVKEKETEIKNIIMIIEGIRYGLMPDEIGKYLIDAGRN